MTRRFDRTPTGAKNSQCNRSVGPGRTMITIRRAAIQNEQALQARTPQPAAYANLSSKVLRTYFKHQSQRKSGYPCKEHRLPDETVGRLSLSPTPRGVVCLDRDGAWTKPAQMSVNQKRDEFAPKTLSLAAGGHPKPAKAKDLIFSGLSAVRNWGRHSQRKPRDPRFATPLQA